MAAELRIRLSDKVSLAMATAEVVVLYSIDPMSQKAREWSDGFVEGMRSVTTDFDVFWMNTYGFTAADLAGRLADRRPTAVLAKSAFGWTVDSLLRSAVERLRGRTSFVRGIVVSGVTDVTKQQADWYDLVVYQTRWFGRTLPSHRNLVHAYGIDKRRFSGVTQSADPTWDYLFVGTGSTPEKRIERLAAMPGRRAVAGRVDDPELTELLCRAGVVLLGEVSRRDLPDLYAATKCVYVPCSVRGGGERVVMEAMACGVPVQIEPDNPKLSEVMAEGGAWDASYYGSQISRGLHEALKARASR